MYRKSSVNPYLLALIIITIALIVSLYNYTVILNEYNDYKDKTYRLNMKVLFDLVEQIWGEYVRIMIRLENITIVDGAPVYSPCDKETIVMSSIDADILSNLASGIAFNNNLPELSNALSNIQLASHRIHQKLLSNEKQTMIVLLNDKDLLRTIIDDLNNLWKLYRNFTISGNINEEEVKKISDELLRITDMLIDDLDKVPTIVK